MSQLSLLSPEERMGQLASELKTALDHAQGAKASGNTEQKRIAGEVIRQLKLEIRSNAFKEEDIHVLMAQQGVSTKSGNGVCLQGAATNVRSAFAVEWSAGLWPGSHAWP
jgi:hypothetical protein